MANSKHYDNLSESTKELLRQRQTTAFKEGQRDGNVCKGIIERKNVDVDYAAGVESGYRLYLAGIQIT